MPYKVILLGQPGWGKTTVGAYAPKPLLLLAPRETGYDTLASRNTVPDVPSAIVTDWADAMAWCDSLANDQQGAETLVLDALGGFAELAAKDVCRRSFGGDIGKFNAFGSGIKDTAPAWRSFLDKLTLISSRGISLILLGHSKTATFKNPLGADYDRWGSDIDQLFWTDTDKWADAVLFGTYNVMVKADGQATKGKALGGTDRVVYTQAAAGWQAKNRYQMPEVIEINGGHDTMYAQIFQHITGAVPQKEAK